MKLKELLEEAKDLKSIFKKFVESSKGGHKLIVKVNGKNKTLYAGSTEGGMDDNKHDKYDTKCYKFLEENDTFEVLLKYHRTGPMGIIKWNKLGELDVKDGEITKEIWYA